MLLSKKKTYDDLPDITLEGFRVVLRPLCAADQMSWSAVRQKNQAFLKPYEPSWAADCLGADFFARRLSRQAYEWQAGRGQYFLLCKKEDDSLIGGININNICRGAAQYGSLGYWIDEDHQGQGYMAEALRLIIQYAFEDLALHRLHAGCILSNQRSMDLLQRTGFKEEGKADKYLKIDGRWQDHILYGLTVENWASSKAA